MGARTLQHARCHFFTRYFFLVQRLNGAGDNHRLRCKPFISSFVSYGGTGHIESIYAPGRGDEGLRPSPERRVCGFRQPEKEDPDNFRTCDVVDTNRGCIFVPDNTMVVTRRPLNVQPPANLRTTSTQQVSKSSKGKPANPASLNGNGATVSPEEDTDVSTRRSFSSQEVSKFTVQKSTKPGKAKGKHKKHKKVSVSASPGLPLTRLAGKTSKADIPLTLDTNIPLHCDCVHTECVP
jgi:hypothetical protein